MTSPYPTPLVPAVSFPIQYKFPKLYGMQMKSLFSDNSLVYYKNHTLSSNVTGSGVRNNRHRMKHT